MVILNKPLFSFHMPNNSFDLFLIFFVHKTQCVNFKFHIYNKTLLGLEILCHIVYLLSLIFWFSMWRVCLRNFCHVFIIYKLLLLLCHILFEVLQAKLYCSSILLCIHFNHPLYMRGSRNFFSERSKAFFGNFNICEYKKFKDPPPLPLLIRACYYGWKYYPCIMNRRNA